MYDELTVAKSKTDLCGDWTKVGRWSVQPVLIWWPQMAVRMSGNKVQESRKISVFGNVSKVVNKI